MNYLKLFKLELLITKNIIKSYLSSNPSFLLLAIFTLILIILININYLNFSDELIKYYIQAINLRDFILGIYIFFIFISEVFENRREKIYLPISIGRIAIIVLFLQLTKISFVVCFVFLCLIFKILIGLGAINSLILILIVINLFIIPSYFNKFNIVLSYVLKSLFGLLIFYGLIPLINLQILNPIGYLLLLLVTGFIFLFSYKREAEKNKEINLRYKLTSNKFPIIYLLNISRNFTVISSFVLLLLMYLVCVISSVNNMSLVNTYAIEQTSILLLSFIFIEFGSLSILSHKILVGFKNTNILILFLELTSILVLSFINTIFISLESTDTSFVAVYITSALIVYISYFLSIQVFSQNNLNSKKIIKVGLTITGIILFSLKEMLSSQVNITLLIIILCLTFLMLIYNKFNIYKE